MLLSGEMFFLEKAVTIKLSKRLYIQSSVDNKPLTAFV